MTVKYCQRISCLKLDFSSVTRNKASYHRTGSIDPWHALSILQNQTNGEVAVYMRGSAHCANMHPEEPTDPIDLKNGRKVRRLFKYHDT